MNEARKPLDNIVPFPMEAVRRLGFQRVEKRRPDQHERGGQQSLFDRATPEVLRFPSRLGPFEEALLADERGDERAAELYERAIAREDEAADAYCNLGIIRSKAKDTVGAFECFTKSLELDSRHLESHYNLGNLYFATEDLRLARLHYEIAASLDPQFANVFFNLGLVYALQRQLREAVDALSSYKELAPADSVADDLLDCLSRMLSRS